MADSEQRALTQTFGARHASPAAVVRPNWTSNIPTHFLNPHAIGLGADRRHVLTNVTAETTVLVYHIYGVVMPG